MSYYMSINNHVFAITCSVLEYLNTCNKLSILDPILVRLYSVEFITTSMHKATEHYIH